MAMEESEKPAIFSFFSLIPKKYHRYGRALIVIIISIIFRAPVRVLSTIWHVLWTTVGVALGTGFGLGLAMHIYHQLEAMRGSHEQEKKQKKSRRRDKFTPRSSAGNSAVSREPTLEDSSSYVSLMFMAGYPVEDKVLRGQVLRENSSFWDVQYQFTGVPVSEQRAPNIMKKDWPSLPPQVATELGRFIEHIMRDFIAGWYCKIDAGCVYEDEKEKRKDKDGTQPEEKQEDPDQERHSNETNAMKRKMVFSAMTHRRIPMLDQTYRLMTQVFGNLATRTEHVNVFSLALLKWTQVLAHTFRVYRTLRKSAQAKNKRRKPTEIQVTKEFLLAGKLHPAVTFGLDVPSLLFADASGEECGTGTDQPPKNPMQVLEERLYGTPLLRECELDYNRMLAHRLVRALLPKSDSSSPVALALLVELFGAFCLLPIMNLFVPSFLNSLIVSMFDKQNGDNPDDKAQESQATTENASNTATNAADEDTNGSHRNRARTRSNSSGQGYSQYADESQGEQSAELSEGAGRTRLSTISSPNSSETNNLFVEDPVGDLILRLMSEILDKLQNHMNFDECREAGLNNQDNLVDWDNSECQAAVLKLVMLVEAILLNGRCEYRNVLTGGKEVEGTEQLEAERSNDEREDQSSNGYGLNVFSLPHVLMEMTSSMAEFDAKIELASTNGPQQLEEKSAMDFEPESGEVSTLRTLISTWLHSGQLSRAISLIVKGFRTEFAHFYSDDAFLAIPENAETLAEMMRSIHGVEIMVETMSVLSSARLDLEIESANLNPSGTSKRTPKAWTVVKSASARVGPNDQWTLDPMTHFQTMTTPRHLDFHKNLGFASSLREERERRLRSWESLKFTNSIQTVHRRRASASEIELHEEVHNLARLFYNGTNFMSVRDAARNTGEKVALLTVEVLSNRRRIEVPDDDSSFLLKAQPRPLNPVSVHRDDRNHELSYKCFLATYEEPAIPVGSKRYTGGRFIRRCFLQYYPIDRTASVTLHNDARKIDKRKGKSLIPDSSMAKYTQSVPVLSDSFLRERHLCQKWMEKETTVSSFFSSTVMETSDFNATPRSGKAVDFIYRMSLFQRPSVDLAGKCFTLQDSGARGAHRADASAMEVSDASLSGLLLSIGRDFRFGDPSHGNETGVKQQVEMGPDGYPMLFMKANKKQGDQVSTEMKPYRISFVRAALMVTATRQEAQLQCLRACVLAGSAKSATKARVQAQLKPTLKILDFANDRSTDRSKMSSLLRDLKLGVYHIDREQLRRNGLLNPRDPTMILELRAKVEDAVEAKDVPYPIGGKMPAATVLYRIKCEALIQYTGINEDEEDMEPYLDNDGLLASQFREEWIVYRTIKDFQSFHKQIKSEVAATESSASTGSRLVGAATAAFGSTAHGRRQRKVLVPSLNKTSGIAVTRNAIVRRGELLGEYLEDLLSPDNLINRCMELLLFLGAFHPFPPEVKVKQTPSNYVDPLGRSNFSRSIPDIAKLDSGGPALPALPRRRLGSSGRVGSEVSYSNSSECMEMGGLAEGVMEASVETKDQIPAILNKVDQGTLILEDELLIEDDSLEFTLFPVPLGVVRNSIVELVRYQFGFENASFFRSQMLAALETASFVAMTKASSFRSMLYDLHVQYLNSDAVAKWINTLLGVLWPDGVWMTPREPYTEDEEKQLREDARQKLHAGFPEQIAAILGHDLTRDGLDIVHEMLQNRVVIRCVVDPKTPRQQHSRQNAGLNERPPVD
eukprot:scaffold5799_cov110-Cylindrotheca_fusiformis.AAC.6